MNDAKGKQLKRLPGGPGYKAALRDPYVELDASGKKLGKQSLKQNHDGDDGLDGFSELAAALISTLRSKEKVVVLEELCLRGNRLRTTALKDLAEIVELAAGDLRDLDLSENDLVIESETDILAWERFLSSFSRCYMLRRLDLSSNSLGAKGFEVLAKMYGKEAPLELQFNSRTRMNEDITPSPSDEDLVMLESTKPATLRTRAASNARELAMEGNTHRTPTKIAFRSTKTPRQSEFSSISASWQEFTKGYTRSRVASKGKFIAIQAGSCRSHRRHAILLHRLWTKIYPLHCTCQYQHERCLCVVSLLCSRKPSS